MSIPSTAVVLRRCIKWLIVACVLGLICYGVLVVVQQLMRRPISLSVGRATLAAEVVQKPAELKKGLAGRKKLESQQAMLFVFPQDKRWTIWMKGMDIPLDILWLDANKKVIHIETDVQPDGEPHKEYQPDKPARYVVEAAAGVVKRYGIRVGQSATFELSEAAP